MNQKLRTYIFFCFFILIGFSNNAFSNNEISKVDLSKFDAKLSGSLNKRNITMYLDINANKISGLYQYGDNIYYLSLEGTVSKDGHSLIFERNGKGKITGQFQGIISENNFSGKWSKPDNSKEYNFVLTKLDGKLMDTIASNNVAQVKPINSKNESSRLIYIIVAIAIGGIGYFIYKRFQNPKATSIKEEVIQSPVTTKIEETTQKTESSSNLKQKEDIKESLDPNVGKGLDFEKFVVNKFESLNKNDVPYFTLIHWQSDKGSNGVYPKSNSNPDLVYNFQLGSFRRKFAVECKYRTAINDTINFCTAAQLNRYKMYSKAENIDVYIVIGLAGTPDKPKEFFTIPLKDIESTEIEYYDLCEYYRSTTFFYNTNTKLLNPPRYKKETF
jgi:hypothetical protein